MIKLIADFVAPLVTVTLPLAAVFDSIGLILGQILPSSSGPTSVSPRSASGGAYGSTADRFALLLTWMFVRGVPALPRDGMAALPAQLAAPLGDRIRLGQAVRRVTGTSVETDDGTWAARHVVVATGAPEAAGLTGVRPPATITPIRNGANA